MRPLLAAACDDDRIQMVTLFFFLGYLSEPKKKQNIRHNSLTLRIFIFSPRTNRYLHSELKISLSQALTTRAGKQGNALPNDNLALHRIVPRKTKTDKINTQFLKIREKESKPRKNPKKKSPELVKI